jgi:ketosteroid isomerase-like protein
MSTRKVAQDLFDHMQVGDVDEILRMVTPDAAVFLRPLQVHGSMATEGADYLHELARSFPDLLIRLRRLFVTTDNTAVAEITIEGTQADAFLEAANLAKHVDLDQAWMLEVTPDGRISAVTTYWDQNQLYRRLGVKRLDIAGSASNGSIRSRSRQGEAVRGTEALRAGSGSTTREATARATVFRFFDAYRARDVERMVELCADNADFRYVPFEVWGRQRVLHGEGKVCTVGKPIWTALIDAFPDLTNTVTSVRADGEGNVAVQADISGTQTKAFGVIACAGGHYELPHLFLFHVTGHGLIDDVVSYWDNAHWKKQLGWFEVD